MFDFIFFIAENSFFLVLSWKVWGLDFLWLGFPKLLMAILVSFCIGDRSGCNGHLRDVLYHKFNVEFQQNVQLKCNFRQGAPQLFEVLICFDTVGIPIHCRERFDSCGGKTRFPRIYFLDANTLPNKCVFFFMKFLSLFVSLKFHFYFGINFLILFFFLLCSYISRGEL